jgi:Undecaprenyl-phosphate glucose phosphotransferase
MLQETVTRSNSRSSATHSSVTLLDVAQVKSKGTPRLNTIVIIYATLEFLAVVSSAYFIVLIYYGLFLGSSEASVQHIIAAGLIATLVLFTSLGLHCFVAIRRQPRHVFLWRGAGAVLLAFSIFLSIIFVTKHSDEYSRATFVLQMLGVGVTVTSLRALFYSWFRSAIASNRIEARRVALIGDISHCRTFADRLNASGIQTVGSFHFPQRRDMKGEIITNSKIREFIAGCRSLRPDDVVVLASNKFLPAAVHLASSLAALPVAIHVVPVDALNVFASAHFTEFGNLQTIQLYRAPLSNADLFIKRAIDIIIATIALIVLTPIFLVVAIAIKLGSPGPILFRQTRHGFNNEEIRVLKFRSMASMEDGDQFRQAVENDARVTRIGRIIRRTNIDELPQLFNVLHGEMSIVGPRPHPTALNALFSELIPPLSRRHNVKPGITGWAQINGLRGPTDTLEKMQRRIEYDLHYVDNWSLLFDIKIIVLTLFSRRAYMNAY